jgi:hypothetical protein
MDRQALRDELQAFGESKEPFDDAVWLVGEAIVAIRAVATRIQSDEPLDAAALRGPLEDAASELRAARKIFASARGASPELVNCLDRWLALSQRLITHAIGAG